MATFACRLFFVLSLWCVLLGPCSGVLYTTTCLKFEEDYNFKESQYVGTWYEVRRLHDPSDPEQEDCVVMNYQLRDEGRFDILQSFQFTDDGAPIYRSGWAAPRIFKDSRVPKFLERFNTTAGGDPDTYIDIVATDYTSYAIVYSCTSINGTHHSESAWVLSRQTQLSKDDVDIVNLFLKTRFRHEDHKWRATQQTADFCKPSLVESLTTKSSSNVVLPLLAVSNLVGIIVLFMKLIQ